MNEIPDRSSSSGERPRTDWPTRPRPSRVGWMGTGLGPESHGTGQLSDSVVTAGWLAERVRRAAPARAILLHAPAAAFQAPGGGENQLLQSAFHLERLGWPVRPFCAWTDRLAGARLLHLFGMSREGLELARVARRLKVPVVLSPICWVEPRAIRVLERGLLRKSLALTAWAARAALPLRMGWRSELLELADAILPNSWAEAGQLHRLFGAVPGRIRVIPNGVEPRFASADPRLFRTRTGIEDEFVLHVGRIEPRKNLLGLARALRPIERTLVVIGDVVPGHERYAEACQRAARGKLHWLRRIEHGDPLLASAYGAARVFAMPSWFETPGLVCLEAGLAGCPLVVTPYGSTREYFEGHARYARPDRPGEIARAIDEAWSAPRTGELAEAIGERYLWQEVARKLAEVYEHVAA